MKWKASVLFCLLCSFLLLVSGCNSSKDQGYDTVEKFLNTYFTIDAETVRNFNTNEKEVANSILKTVERFKDMCTDRTYHAIISNIYYISDVMTCKKDGTVNSPENIKITKNSQDGDVIKYDFTASYKITGSDNNVTTKSCKGQISVTKQKDGKYKISYFGYSDL